MAVKAIRVSCCWCETEETFAGDDPEKQWRESGWFVHLIDDEQKDYCCIDCCIAAL